MKNLHTKAVKYSILNNKALLLSWLLLMIFTLISVALGALNIDKNWLIPAVLLTVYLKGQQIIDVFMALKTAPTKWRLLLLSYVVILPVIIALIYLF
ncbi:MAG: cytochrome c oxidase subunit 4 [Alteromonadaceae bacterium]|jgi:cytochrome c oxidase subunit 4